MVTAQTLADLRAILATQDPRRAVALVPTMGALHAGHGALVETAVAHDALVVASIFVNPTQFGPGEDFARYPRDEATDLAKLRAWGCRVAWLPDAATMYPPGDATTIVPAGPAQGWEGDMRPGHFQGVATVVAKLFGQVHPAAAYFGEKDWQQLQVIRRMVADLHLPVGIVAVATVRADDGLALASRNRFLTAEERALAPLLYRALTDSAAAIAHGAAPATRLAAAREALGRAGFALDYLDMVDAGSMARLTHPSPTARLIAAVRLGAARLLDNVPVILPLRPSREGLEEGAAR